MSSDALTATGLTVESASDITSALSAGFQSIYGADINLDQNSPDGQVVGIVTQMAVDLRELLVQINASFDPDQAVGIQLDQRCAINGVKRGEGTFSIFPITVVVNQTVALQGLDSQADNPNGTGYTIQDGSGNKYILLDSATFTSGTTIVDFRAQNSGPVTAALNTITTPVTVINGVTSVTNASAPTTIGETEQTDVQLRVLRQNSVSLPSLNYLKGLRAKLLNISGVTDAEVYDNRTSSTNGNGIPAHSIWAIVEGGANTDIANTIAGTISDGAGMYGATSVNITTDSGVIVPISFDRPTAENLYIEFTIKTTVPGTSFNTAGIANYIANNLSYEAGGFAETSEVTAIAAAAINSLGGGGVPVLVNISIDDATWTDFLQPTNLNYQFTIAANNINITVI